MTFAFPGHTATPAPTNTRQQYLVQTDNGNTHAECDYIQFTPTHVTFWDDADPYDVLIIGLPLRDGTVVRKVGAPS